MSCARCSSLNEVEFTGEVTLHVCSSTSTKLGVLTFPVVLVCLDCGAARFNTPTKELWLLREEARRSAAA
jgi:hypothetical protein